MDGSLSSKGLFIQCGVDLRYTSEASMILYTNMCEENKSILEAQQ